MKTHLKKYSIAKIYREQENIDLDPFFQRDKVWSQKKKQLFIDTLLRGWGVPKVYLAVTFSSGSNIYQCVDGKQRLSTILEFLDNEKFRLDQSISKELGAKNYKELSGVERDRFNDYKLHIEEVTHFSDKELAELFQRLQLGSALNSGEKLNAIDGGMIDFARHLTKHGFLKNKISILNTRHAFLAVAGQICLLEIFGIRTAKFKDLQAFFGEFKTFKKTSIDGRQIKLVLSYLDKVFPIKSAELNNRGSIISAYLLISHLIQRGNIMGKQRKIWEFFVKFNMKLKREIRTSGKTADPDYLRYQTALLQSADSQKSIFIRHQILLTKLANFDPYFRKLINTTIEEDEFMDSYNKLLRKHNGKIFKLEAYFLSLIPKVSATSCGRGVETIPTHIRNSIHHPEHKKHTKAQLNYALKLLRTLTSK